ncbi:hypothetical protein ACIQGZ_18400 [Streptomyces sp. NPDC092296]|uniref:hypothetical protein n=1 Tax=Streptomyces sp. NPDC092296 TaxID=3366012 RepID=UPI00382A0E44
MDLPVRALLILTRNQLIPLAYRLRADRRARVYAADRPVAIPCRLDAESRAGLLADHKDGRLTLSRPGAPLLFTPEGGAPATEIPSGGTIVLVTGCQPTRLASHVDRVVTRYEARRRHEFWIETTAFDAPLLHRALTPAP